MKNQSNDDEESKRSQIRSPMNPLLASPKQGHIDGRVFPNSDGKEHQEISQDAKDTVQEQGNLEAHEILMITDTEKVQVVLMSLEPQWSVQVATRSRTGNAHKATLIVSDSESKNASGSLHKEQRNQSDQGSEVIDEALAVELQRK